MFVGGNKRTGKTAISMYDTELTSISDYGVIWLTDYTDRDRQENCQDVKKEIYNILKEKLSILNEWFYKIDESGFKSSKQLDKFRTIQGGANFVLENEKRKKQFLSITKTIKSAFVIALGVLDGETKTKVN